MGETNFDILHKPSKTLVELEIPSSKVDAQELIAGAFAVSVYFNQLFPGDTKPENVNTGLKNILHEVVNVINVPQSEYAKRELWYELNYHTSFNGLQFSLRET